MKAVILEVKNGYAAALKDDGTVVKIKDENYNIGDVIRMNEKKPFFNKKWGTLVAALLIFAMVGTTTYVNAAPSFDVYLEDSSSEYDFLFRVNKSGKVIEVFVGEDKNEPIELNDENLVLEGMGIEEAIEAVLLDQGWDDESIVTVAAKNIDDAEKLAQRIRDRINEDEEEGEQEREREEKTVESISNEMVREAKAEGIAPGKMNIINKIFEEADEDFEIAIGDKTFETKDQFIREIRRTEDTKELMKDLMKAYSGSKGKESAPGQLKKQEEVQTENRNIEQNTEENQEMNGNKPEGNPGNKGGNGKGN